MFERHVRRRGLGNLKAFDQTAAESIKGGRSKMSVSGMKWVRLGEVREFGKS